MTAPAPPGGRAAPSGFTSRTVTNGHQEWPNMPSDLQRWCNDDLTAYAPHGVGGRMLIVHPCALRRVALSFRGTP